jgi:flagellar motor switch protein FliG
MEKEKIIDVIKNVEDRSNKDLNETLETLYQEFDKTKGLIIDLTRHLESVENSYNVINEELKKRYKK